MKNSILTQLQLGRILSFLSVFFLILSAGCYKILDELNPHSGFKSKQVNLVSDTAGFGAARIDKSLVNAWGIAINPTAGIFWISSNGAGLSVVYDKNGQTVRPPVDIPFQGVPHASSPSGVVFNGTLDFIIPANGMPAKFIFATENGTLTAWNSGNSTIMVADRSSTGTVYKGIELANDGTSNFLVATDFHNGKIDVFDKKFKLISSKPFKDPGIPKGFAPFNVRLIDKLLYITYAKQLPPENKDDEAGPGNGYINIFKTDGSLVKRFVSQGALNSPWGIAKLEKGYCYSDDLILVGNFGDGRINAFDRRGNFLNALMDKGAPLVIDGLWTITFPPKNCLAGLPNQLFFSAGPDGEAHGLFGYIKMW